MDAMKYDMSDIKVSEHHLLIKADPLRLKIIAEAIGDYQGKHEALSDDTTLCDFRFNMETEYQRWYSLDEDDYDYTEEHKEELGIV